MAKPSYWELLKDPRWQRKRLEILQRDGWSCRECGDSGSTLHVHHRHYTKGLKPWEYKDKVLITVCEHCHGAISEHHRWLAEIYGRLGIAGLAVLTGMAAALVDKQDGDLPYVATDDPNGETEFMQGYTKARA